LRAYKCPFEICLAKNTFPKAPDPNYFIKSKDENCILSPFRLLKSIFFSSPSDDFYSLFFGDKSPNDVFVSGY
jgi:hypothetical protein